MRRAWILCIVVAAQSGFMSVAAEIPSTTAAALECIPPSALVIPGGMSLQTGPPVAVVDTMVKPGRTRLYLDGRYLGLAKDFDGGPDYLFLRPGTYALELQLPGFAGVSYRIEARGGCLFELRHRMDRIPGTAKDPWWGSKPRPQPFLREYGPVKVRVEATPALPASPTRPDLSLRPELAAPRVQPGLATDQDPAATGASLRLVVEPVQAVVYLDGDFLVTAAELESLHEPLAVSSGPHQIEVMAPGYVPSAQSFVVGAGEELELVLKLESVGE